MADAGHGSVSRGRIPSPGVQAGWSFGRYSTYQLGYQTTVLGIEREPERNCFFAGEHTADQNGFLNSAVETGQRAARQVAASLV